MTMYERALMVAKQAHGNQSYGAYPYEYHLIAVAEKAKSFRFSEYIVTACYLHDILEDTSISYNKLKKEFGKTVADIVYDVTDELGKTRAEKKAKTYPKIRNNKQAVIVKLCDRMVNIEFSKHDNGNKFKMYQEEHDSFREGLYDKEHRLDDMWDELAELLNR